MTVEAAPRRLFISAGEISGDLHGSYLLKALRRQAEQRGVGLDIQGLGSAGMAAAGATLLENTRAHSAVGLAEALPWILPTIAMLSRIKRQLRRRPPELAVLIDYPGINVPLARFLSHKMNVPVIYYIPPDEWRWSTLGNGLLDRTDKLIRSVSRIIAVHPREAEYFRGRGCDVVYVGHPLLDVVKSSRLSRSEARASLGIAGDEKIVALLPASRHQELRLLWPIIADAASSMLREQPELKFLLPLASPHLEKALARELRRLERSHPDLHRALDVIVDPELPARAAERVIAAADLGVAKAGSVSLEMALHDVPQVIVFRLGRLTDWFARLFLRLTPADCTKLALVNHIMDEEIVAEFTEVGRTAISGGGASSEAIAGMGLDLLNEASFNRRQQLAGYARLRGQLMGAGAADRAATTILDMLTAS